MGLIAKHETEIDLAKATSAPAWMKARAARFLAKWRLLKSTTGQDRTHRSAEKKSDTGPSKRPLHYFQLGLDASGKEFEISELVSWAILSSAFIKTTDMIFHVRNALDMQVDYTADISVAAKGFLTFHFSDDRSAVLQSYGQLFNIVLTFPGISSMWTNRAAERKLAELRGKGVVLESAKHAVEHLNEEEKNEILRITDFTIVKEIIKVSCKYMYDILVLIY